MHDFSIVLQAGGKSSRMGADKALVPFRGTILLGYILKQVRTLSDDLILISNRPADYARFGLPVFSDVYPDWGALGGLHAAIYHAPRDLCLVLACDMPFVNQAFLLHLLAESAGYDAVIPRLGPDRLAEPFRAVYRKSCLAPIEAAIAAGRRRANSFFEEVSARFVDENEILSFDPDLRTFFNVNTPEDLEIAERMASDD